MSGQKNNPGSLTETLLGIGANVANNINTLNTSVASFSSDLQVVPICLVDSKLQHLPETYDIVSGALTFFSSCYVASALLLSNTKIKNALITIDRINPKRKARWESASENFAKLSNEFSEEESQSHDFTIKLFSAEEIKRTFEPVTEIISPEDVSVADERKMEESGPLSMGKVIHLDVSGDTYQEVTKKRDKDGNVTEETKDKNDIYKIPVHIRFESFLMTSRLITDFLMVTGMDKSFFGLLRAWRRDERNLSEILTMKHVVKARQKLLLKDKKGRIAEILDRRTGNLATGIATGQSSLGTIANTVVISDRTRKEVEHLTGIRLEEDEKRREAMMEESSTMILIVVDEESEMTTMYVHGQSKGSDIPISQYKKAGKKDGNITDIINAFKVGNTPGFR